MRITFVHFADPFLYEPGTAALAGLARALGAEVTRLPADFGSRQEDLMAAIAASRPDLLAIRLSDEVREACAHAIQQLRQTGQDLPLALYGPLVSEAPELALGLSDCAFLLLNDPEIGLAGILEKGLETAQQQALPGLLYQSAAGLLRGPEVGPADLMLAPPPAFDLFEPGFSKAAVGGSLFGEPGSLILETVVGSPSGAPANQALLGFNHPTVFPPRLRPVVKLAEQVNLIRSNAKRFELVDREFGFAGSHYGEVLGASETIFADKSLSLRMLASTANRAIINETAPGRVKRIVCELDAVAGAALDLEGAETGAMVESFLGRCRERGFEIGLLASVGLPGESEDDLRQKIDFIRALAPDALRFFPFSPRYGHAWRQIAEREGMMPTGDAAWNREVYVPLKQECMPIESWYLLWQDCLDLQAETQHRRAMALGGIG